MIPTVILAFLIGTVLAFGFRVWIIIPITFVSFVSVSAFELLMGESAAAAFKFSLLVALAPQFGYLFGQLTRIRLVQWNIIGGRRTSASTSSELVKTLRADRPIGK